MRRSSDCGHPHLSTVVVAGYHLLGLRNLLHTTTAAANHHMARSQAAVQQLRLLDEKTAATPCFRRRSKTVVKTFPQDGVASTFTHNKPRHRTQNHHHHSLTPMKQWLLDSALITAVLPQTANQQLLGSGLPPLVPLALRQKHWLLPLFQARRRCPDGRRVTSPL